MHSYTLTITIPMDDDDKRSMLVMIYSSPLLAFLPIKTTTTMTETAVIVAVVQAKIPSEITSFPPQQRRVSTTPTYLTV